MMATPMIAELYMWQVWQLIGSACAPRTTSEKFETQWPDNQYSALIGQSSLALVGRLQAGIGHGRAGETGMKVFVHAVCRHAYALALCRLPAAAT